MGCIHSKKATVNKHLVLEELSESSTVYLDESRSQDAPDTTILTNPLQQQPPETPKHVDRKESASVEDYTTKSDGGQSVGALTFDQAYTSIIGEEHEWLLVMSEHWPYLGTLGRKRVQEESQAELEVVQKRADTIRGRSRTMQLQLEHFSEEAGFTIDDISDSMNQQRILSEKLEQADDEEEAARIAAAAAWVLATQQEDAKNEEHKFLCKLASLAVEHKTIDKSALTELGELHSDLFMLVGADTLPQTQHEGAGGLLPPQLGAGGQQQHPATASDKKAADVDSDSTYTQGSRHSENVRSGVAAVSKSSKLSATSTGSNTGSSTGSSNPGPQEPPESIRIVIVTDQGRMALEVQPGSCTVGMLLGE